MRKCEKIEKSEDELFKLIDEQYKSYRKSLGKEYERRYLDLKIKRALKKLKEKKLKEIKE